MGQVGRAIYRISILITKRLLTSSDEWPVVQRFGKIQKGPLEMKNKFYRDILLMKPLKLQEKTTIFKVES